MDRLQDAYVDLHRRGIKAVYCRVGPWLAPLDRALPKYSHLYRCMAFQRDYMLGAHFDPVMAAHHGSRPDATFADNDQDQERDPFSRKMQLAKYAPIEPHSYVPLLLVAHNQDSFDLTVLHQLHEIRQRVLGDKSVEESQTYIERALLKLRPDNCKDLLGWRPPQQGPRRRVFVDAGVDGAHRGAKNLRLVLLGLRVLLQKPHYQRLLWDRHVALGGSLTVFQGLRDVSAASLLGAIFCVLRGKSVATVLCVGGGLPSALLLLALFQYLRAPTVPPAVDERALVIRRPDSGPSQGIQNA